MTNRPEASPRDFEKLLCDFSAGSLEAAEQLVEMYSSNILRAVRRRLPQAIRPKVDSTDIFQSLWASILSGPRGLSDVESPDRLIAYLASAAQLKVMEKYRHFTQTQARDVTREQQLSDPIDEGDRSPRTRFDRKAYVKTREILVDKKQPTASAVAEAREVWSKLNACTAQDRAVAELRISGLTQREIADRLGISSRTVRRSLQRLVLAIS